ncbi:MAG: hypothetical protein RBU37_01985 [Myxococcota bacterium]|jgi:hypothetical protein|nr:hypothetical protein [Myxococcota bacterium]
MVAYPSMHYRQGIVNLAAQRQWAVRDEGAGLVLEIPLPTRRTQVVHMTPSRDADGLEILFFWSIAAPANRVPDPWSIMQESVRLSYGAYAVKDGNLLVVATRMAQYAQLDELARVVYYVAHYADEMERRLVGAFYDGN